MVRGSLVTAAALVLSLQLAAAAAAAAREAPIALPGCNRTCGDVSVPYPFGFGPSRCYMSGFNLTCDTSQPGPPRLLLGDGSLRVVDIYPQNSTVRVLRDGSMVKGADHVTAADGTINVTFAPMFAGGHYRMSYSGNELVLFGCEMLATLVAGKIRPVKINDDDDGSASVIGCVSFCSGGSSFGGMNQYCSSEGCCQASFGATDWARMPTELHLSPLENRKSNSDQPVSVFLAEQGWLDERDWQKDLPDEFEPKNDIPVILRWDVMQALKLSEADWKRDPYDKSQGCPSAVASLCKSSNSECTWDIEVYQCQCKLGYDGNPYVDGGCQDIDECKHPQENCFGDCTNTEGSFECRCPNGTFGDATVRDACVKTSGSPTLADAPPLAGMFPPPIGLPKCETTCGHVQVPYPFGFGPKQCYLPGFELTCDRSHNPPRLLLGSGNSTLQVVGIFLNDSTVRVIHATTFDVTTATDQKLSYSTGMRFDGDDKRIGINFPNIDGPYKLSARNEFILNGCNVLATLHDTADRIISSCVSNCGSSLIGDPTHHEKEYCSGRDGCCHARIPPGSRPKKVKFKRLINMNISQESPLPPLAFVAEDGQIDQWYMIFNRSTAYWSIRNETWKFDMPAVRRHMASQVPFHLRWGLKQNVSTSAESYCWQEDGSYACRCKDGFYGNPYVIGGCQDIDECKIPRIHDACFGNCINLQGFHDCRCRRGTRGNPYMRDGCVEYLTASTIGLLAASGPAFLLLVLGVCVALRKVKQRRKRLVRLKYFKQNRGQLLQQLVSQRADIAERMVITVDELAKATNNFDKARKLGGGGHGTVYKGILSDQHVVAIKKSNIAVQKEINEFINEVAILSQVNHRNVVKLLGCCLETEVPLLVYEFISNGTLYQHLHVEGPTSLSWSHRLRIAKETANAIAYLHSSVSVPIIHRDIKSSNILLDDALTAKVSDFGASRYIPVEKTGLTTVIQGTIGYMDPMCFVSGRLNEKSDVYSFGVILVELLTRKKPYLYLTSDGDGLVMHFVKLHAEGNLSHILDPQVKEEAGKEVEEVATLAASCIKMSSDDRPTMRQVEHILEGVQQLAKPIEGRITEREEFEKHNILGGSQSREESSRIYSMQQEFVISARYPR